MLNFFRSRSEVAARRRALPQGQRLYVVGDVHGCARLLEKLLAQIAADVAEGAPTEVGAVFLGDYIDRGPNSASVLESLAHWRFSLPLVTLRGNHEEMLLKFLGDADSLEQWRHFGGLETLHSFGVPVEDVRHGQGYETARQRLAEAISPKLLSFIEDTRTHYQSGDYYFCHAGIRPGIELDRQLPHDLLWIRHEFLASTADHGKIIVHGHTPVEAPEFRANRINIDTGAYLTQTLTCLILEGEERRLIQATL